MPALRSCALRRIAPCKTSTRRSPMRNTQLRMYHDMMFSHAAVGHTQARAAQGCISGVGQLAKLFIWIHENAQGPVAQRRASQLNHLTTQMTIQAAPYHLHKMLGNHSLERVLNRFIVKTGALHAIQSGLLDDWVTRGENVFVDHTWDSGAISFVIH